MILDNLNGWKSIIGQFVQTKEFTKMTQFIDSEYQKNTVFPTYNQVFSAFARCRCDQVKVVILGQDPYHGDGQANGLAFSVNDGVKLPPSLKNIFKELEEDTGIQKDKNGNLTNWAEQGVLLLNSVLTVRRGEASSHRKQGWEEFTDEVIKNLSEQKTGLVFILWGNYAKEKGRVIDSKKHFVIQSAHPSPLSAYNGFFGSKPFSQTNKYLKKQGKKPIEW